MATSGPTTSGNGGGSTTGGAGTTGSGGTGGSGGSAMTDAGSDRSAPPTDAARPPDSASDVREASSIDVGPDRTVQDTGPDVPVVGDPESGLLAGITRFHNVVRAEVGVPGLTWDPTIAATAQAYAAKCVFQHSGTAGLGENLAAYAPPGGHTAKSPVDDWESEKANYDYASNTCASGQVCGHYTQVVWRDSVRIGCAIVDCPALTYHNTVICDYAPGGNISGQRPY